MNRTVTMEIELYEELVVDLSCTKKRCASLTKTNKHLIEKNVYLTNENVILIQENEFLAKENEVLKREHAKLSELIK